MTVEEFKWDVTYRNDIDTPEKVTAISALLSDYEHRGITWKSMKGSEIYENNVKKEYALRGEKLDGTSVIHLTGIGNLDDFNELKSEMERLLATYGDSGAAKPATEPSGGAGPTGPGAGAYKPEQKTTASTSQPAAEAYTSPTGGMAKAGQPYTDDELNEFITKKGYGHKTTILSDHWKAHAERMNGTVKREVYKQTAQSEEPTEPSAEMPDFSEFFNVYPGRAIWSEGTKSYTGKPDVEPMPKEPSAEGYAPRTGGTAKKEAYSDDELIAFINKKGYGHKKTITPKPQEPSAEMPDFSEFFNQYPGRATEVAGTRSYTKSNAEKHDLTEFWKEHSSRMTGKITKETYKAAPSTTKKRSNSKAYWKDHNKRMGGIAIKGQRYLTEEQINKMYVLSLDESYSSEGIYKTLTGKTPDSVKLLSGAPKETSAWEKEIATYGKIIDGVNTQGGPKWLTEKVDSKAYKGFLALLGRKQPSKTPTEKHQTVFAIAGIVQEE